MQVKKRTFGYDEFNKISENLEKVGFKTVTEYEDENVDDTSIDDLGEGEEVDLDLDTESESDINTETEDAPKETTDTPIDLDGSTSTVTLETINTYLEFINKFVSSLNGLVKKADTVPLDKATENKIIAIYKAIQGIS